MPSSDRHDEVIAFTVSLEPYVGQLIDDLVQTRLGAITGVPAVEDERGDFAARDSIAVGVALVLSALRVPDDLPDSLPVSSLRALRHAARQGMPIETFLGGYRAAHSVFQEHIYRHAARTALSIGALREVTQNLFGYFDSIPAIAARVYARELADFRTAGARARHLRVERVLGGATDEDLGYDLEGRHIALVLDAEAPPDAGRRLGRALDVAHLSSVTPQGTEWVWLSAADLDVDVVVQRVQALIGDGHAGISEPETGPHGFVGAYRKAEIALRLALTRDIPVNKYRDVALEALAFGGEEIAVDFVRAELGLLVQDNQRAAVLRHTLNEYFANGSSTAATARVLAIAERTVTYRLRRAEELLGHPVSERRADLETALRLYRVLNVT
jgi:hypothetical protein